MQMEVYMEEEILQPDRTVHPAFFFATVIVTASILLTLVYYMVDTFSPATPKIPLQHLEPQKMNGAGEYPAHVVVGLYIDKYLEFDMMKAHFELDAIVTFDFDPSHISVYSLQNFTFDRGEIVYKSNPEIRKVDDKLRARYDIRLKVSNNFNYKFFPMDDHRFSIVLLNKTLTPADLIFETNNEHFVVGQDMSHMGWHNLRQNAEAGYLVAHMSRFGNEDILKYPAVLFTIDYARGMSMRNSATIILPLLMMFFIALFSLTLDANKRSDASSVISMPIQAALGLVTYRFVIESLAPKVGYLLYADYFFFLFLFLTLFILFINILNHKMTVFMKKSCIIGFEGIAVVVFMFMLFNLSSGSY